MFNPSALLSRILPCCATGSSDSSTMKAMLDRNNIGILSAACCDSTASLQDDALRANIDQAMKRIGEKRAVVVESITAAQQQLRTLEAQADSSQRQLIQGVIALFQANGLSIFPLLIIDGRIAFYGGVPTTELIQERLQKRPLTNLSA